MRKIRNDELGRKSLEDFRAAKKRPVVFVLDNIRSLSNIGSVFRTADAFLFQAIYLCGITAQPPHREIHKTALGAEESVEWKYFKTTSEALLELRSEGYILAGIEQAENQVRLDQFKPDANKKYAFIFGNEIQGVAQDVLNLCDLAIEIPQLGTKHSLNIAVCAGIIAWHYSYQSK